MLCCQIAIVAVRFFVFFGADNSGQTVSATQIGPFASEAACENYPPDCVLLS